MPGGSKINPGPPRSAEAGFTLLELVVSLALVSLLSLIAFVALNLSLQAVRRGQTVAASMQELRVGQTYLARSLSSIAPGIRGTRISFIGEPQEMSFFTFEPLEAFNLGGIYRWRVLVGRDEEGQGALAVEQTKDLSWKRDPDGVEIRQILIHNVEALSFTYGRAGKDYDRWDSRRHGGLPDWVQIHLTLVGQEPQDWLIPIYVLKSENINR